MKLVSLSIYIIFGSKMSESTVFVVPAILFKIFVVIALLLPKKPCIEIVAADSEAIELLLAGSWA